MKKLVIMLYASILFITLMIGYWAYKAWNGDVEAGIYLIMVGFLVVIVAFRKKNPRA